MDACEAVERELNEVLSKYGDIVDKNLEKTITEQISSLMDFKKKFENMGDAFELREDEASLLSNTVRQALESVGRVATGHRKLHTTISKVGKAIDKNFKQDLKPIANEEMFAGGGEGAKILTGAVCQHLYFEGKSAIGDNLCREGMLSMEPNDKIPNCHLQRILDALKDHNLAPAQEWVTEHRDVLNTLNSSLEFKLHRLAFLILVQQGSQSEAIQYARNNFGNFSQRHAKDIQALMGCMVIRGGSGSCGANSPYASFFDNTLWKDIVEVFTCDAYACVRLGLTPPIDSPLATCFEAGCTALPALSNIGQVLQSRKLSALWDDPDELPIEIDLEKKLHYHSIFVCPILRQQTTETNPPMRLKCGHIISKEAIEKLIVGDTVKCPYCPVVQNSNEPRRVEF